MHCSERNLDVRVSIMPTIHPIYRRNNLENNLQNNGINFTKQPVVFENKPTIAITKAKARATAKATAKAITKENLSSCQAGKPPRERSFLFLDRMILVKRRMAVQEAFALPWGTPPQLRIRSAAPPEVEPRALRAGLHHSSNHTVDVQTPPASLHSATSPSRGGKGAARRACTLIWVQAEIRGYGRMPSAPTVRVGKPVIFNRDAPGFQQRFCHEL